MNSGLGKMSFDRWKAHIAQKSRRELERRQLEEHFNAEIIRRHRAGKSKEEIVADLGISRELFNRVMRSGRQRG